MSERWAAKLVKLQRKRIVGRIAREALALWSVDIPKGVKIGEDFRLEHRGHGVVINDNTTVGDHVTIYHNVTIARSNSWVPVAVTGRAVIEDDVVLCPGAVVLAGSNGVTVGRGTVLGANSTLCQSTGEWEVWAGSPARRIRRRRVAGEYDQLASVRKGVPVPRE